jgi:hypothetical protein
MPLAYHKDVDFEFFVPAAFVLLGLLTLSSTDVYANQTTAPIPGPTGLERP